MIAVVPDPRGTPVAPAARAWSAPRNGLAPMSHAVSSPRPEDEIADRERLAAVVRDHIDFVWRVLRRQGLSSADADDGVQRVFLVFREKANGVEAGTEKGFLFRVASYIAKELRRGAGRFEELTDAKEGSEPSPSRRTEAADLLERCMRDLDDAERDAFVLFEIEGLTMLEIARIVDCPAGTVASRLRRARDKVKQAAARLELADGDET